MITRQPSCDTLVGSDTLTVDQALKRILCSIKGITEYEQVDLVDARSRTLHETIYAPFDVPGHDNAAVDGYAIHSSDIPEQGFRELQIIGQVYAGQAFSGKLQPGQCIRITTGAPIPSGVDSVIMQEHVAVEHNKIRIDHQHRVGQNIRLAGEDVCRGEAILKAGRWLTPADIGLLASIGVCEIKVRRKLRIAIASTGDELYSTGEQRSDGGIYDSNRYGLQAALSRPDIDIIDLGILSDNPNLLIERFASAGRYADMVISSGGVSIGDADYTKSAMELSGQIDFWKIAIKPGRPLAYGSLGKSIFFGLPGNPVAVLVGFYLFVRPAIDKLLGINEKPAIPRFRAISNDEIRKKAGRTEVVRGILERNPDGEWRVKTTGSQGSGILRSMSLANAFIILEHDRGNVDEGESVTVLPFAGLMT